MTTRIALAGNPNSGKTTLFNALTGSNQYVGNWPGVTVEKKEGKLKSNKDVRIVDLPGIYSLSPYTLEEVVARNYLVDEKPDAIVNIIDGTNLERNLYLTTQLVELNMPVVVAINMMDIVRKNGDEINVKQLEKQLGCSVITISAIKNENIDQLMIEAIRKAEAKVDTIHQHKFNGVVEHAIAHIEEACSAYLKGENEHWYAIKIFERDERITEKLKIDRATLDHIEKDIVAAETELDDDAESIMTNERYNYIAKVVKKCYIKKNKDRFSTSDKIDRIITNRILALPIFVVIMWLVYAISVQGGGSLLHIGDSSIGVVEQIFGVISDTVSGWLVSAGAAGWLQGLIIDGIIGGVGAVLGFVPQMLILFLMLSFLEQCGYMSRIAFIMDRMFRRFGLSGKSFVPMLVSSGCAVPGVMATRTIESDRDRRMTIMTTCFVPCGAKMPIIALIAGAVFGGNSALIATAAYFIGVAAIVVSGIILKKTKMFSGDPAPFVMELPAYHFPTLKGILSATWERGWSFIKRAGTVILLASIFIWFTASYGFGPEGFGAVDDMEISILGTLGNGLRYIFVPLGFGDHWQSVVATIMGLVAKEEVVGVFGTLSSIGDADVAMSATEALTDPSSLAVLNTIGLEFFGASALKAFSFMVFNLLCAPCFAAIGAIKREMNSAKWTWFAIGYQTTLAYTAALMIYQFGTLFVGDFSLVGVIISAIVLATYVYLLLRPAKNIDKLSMPLGA